MITQPSPPGRQPTRQGQRLCATPWGYRELDYAVFPVTLHPDVSGRPQVLLMLERLIDRWRGHEGVRFVTFEEAAADFRARYPFDGAARASSVGSTTQ